MARKKGQYSIVNGGAYIRQALYISEPGYNDCGMAVRVYRRIRDRAGMPPRTGLRMCRGYERF